MPSERQKKAQDLANWLGSMPGVWIVSPLPLDDDARLRFQVLDSRRDEVVTALCEGGWIPAFLQGYPRFTPSGLIPACLYEITNMQKDRQPVPVETKAVPRDYAAEREVRKNMEKEVERFRKTIGGK